MLDDMRDGFFQGKSVTKSLPDEHPQSDAFGVDHPGVRPHLRIKLFTDLG